MGTRLNRVWARRVGASLVVAAAIAALSAATTPAVATPPAAAAANSGVVDVAVSFQVRNVNRSDVACASDGKTYTERGHLLAPAAALRGNAAARSITLYLHGLSFGEFFWNFTAVSGYDYARHQAQAGQASVILDRLGYGDSDKPAGKAICVGARADIAHQEVQALRAGTYTVDGVGQAPKFGHVDLAGHSYGGQIAQVEAYSFGDIDGLIVISYSDVIQSARLKAAAAYTAKVCARGGLPVVQGGPRGYAPFGPPAKATAALFHSVAPSVLKSAKPMLSLDPCGDTASFAAATKADLKMVSRIHVPVLIVAGASDKLFPPPALAKQAVLYTAASSVTAARIADTAHAITLERTRHSFEHAVLDWLRFHN